MNIKQLLTEKYKATFDEFCEGKYDPEYCLICYKLICEPAYIIHGDEPGQMHNSCGELPTEIQHPLHPRHPLKIQSLERRFGDVICDGCRHMSLSLNYECKKCKFRLDFKCVFEYEGQALVEKVEAFTNYHRHKLQLLHASISLLALEHINKYIFCCSCLEPFRDSFYACVRCGLFIHQSCLDTIPEQVESSFHAQHPLFPRITTSGYGRCRGCGKRVKGIELRCQRCEYSFHVSCGKHTTPSIRLVVHKHNLFYVCHSPARRTGRCAECEERCEGARYRCVQCDENFHVECILPQELTHECHDHPLTLTNSVVPKCNPNEFRCDICEMEGDLKHHVYHCEECYYIAHIECVLSEEDPPLEMVLKSTDDSEQKINEVQEDGSGYESEMYDLEESSDDSEESSDDSEDSCDDSEESGDEEQKNDKLNKKIAKVKKQIEGLTFELQLLEFRKRQRELSQSYK